MIEIRKTFFLGSKTLYFFLYKSILGQKLSRNFLSYILCRIANLQKGIVKRSPSNSFEIILNLYSTQQRFCNRILRPVPRAVLDTSSFFSVQYSLLLSISTLVSHLNQRCIQDLRPSHTSTLELFAKTVFFNMAKLILIQVPTQVFDSVFIWPL